jgi:hypothetical protein
MTRVQMAKIRKTRYRTIHNIQCPSIPQATLECRCTCILSLRDSSQPNHLSALNADKSRTRAPIARRLVRNATTPDRASAVSSMALPKSVSIRRGRRGKRELRGGLTRSAMERVSSHSAVISDRCNAWSDNNPYLIVWRPRRQQRRAN